MPSHSFKIAKDSGELSGALAQYICEQAKGKDSFSIAFSGGSLPKLASAALVQPPYVDQVEWAKWKIFFVDERCVPLDHGDSNYLALKTHLLDKLPQPLSPSQVVTYDPSTPNPAAAAENYEEQLKTQVPSGSLDLVLLGMGEDGHTASLFPNHPLLQFQEGLVASISDSPKPPPERITLTYPCIHAASEVAVVAAGGGKAEILASILETKDPERVLPVARAQNKAGVLKWFIDEAAAAKLDKGAIETF